MKLRNLRAYVPGTDDSTATPIGGYDTGSGNAILRKINLNVDIATQNELNEAFTTLSNAITATGTEWKAADQQLSADLKAWAKGDELSGAIHNEITAEADRAATAEEAIRTDLSNNYKVSVVKADAPETSAYAATYYVTQGGTQVGANINIPKDYVVKSAALCTVTETDVPYTGAVVGDKYIDFVVNTADQGDEKHIYLPVKDLVDVYTGGTTQFAAVNVDSNRVITTTVSADLISAAAVTTVVGTNADLSGADTVWGAKAYADAVVAGKNVTASGDTLVSADASNNTVTVGATDDLTAAVAKANSAIQYAIGDEDPDHPDAALIEARVTVGDSGPMVVVLPTSRLTDAVDAAETALQTISAGTDGSYVTTTVTAKDANHNQTVGVAVTFGELSAGTAGVAKAEEAKAYVDGKITALSVAATGDAYVEAESTGQAITVAAANRTKAAIDKVEAASATWDAALQSVAADHGTYVTTSVSEKSSNSQTLSVGVVTHTVADAEAGTADGLAVAADVKDYVDTVSAAIAVTATGDNYVSAWVENGKDIKLAAKDKLTAVVNVVETTSASWNGKADLTALTAETAARENADSDLGTRIDNLSATYASKTTVDSAATTLEAAAALAVSAMTDYQDIDQIITELEALKAAVKAFAGSLKLA